MPFRSAKDKEALWQGIKDGTVNAISVNHDPVLRQDKEVNFEDAVPGAISLEIALPALWKPLVDCVGEPRAVELLSWNAAKIAQVEPSAIEVGAKTDLVLLADKEETLVEPSLFAGQVRNCPLLGSKLSGKIKGSYLGGRWTEV